MISYQLLYVKFACPWDNQSCGQRGEPLRSAVNLSGTEAVADWGKDMSVQFARAALKFQTGAGILEHPGHWDESGTEAGGNIAETWLQHILDDVVLASDQAQRTFLASVLGDVLPRISAGVSPESIQPLLNQFAPAIGETADEKTRALHERLVCLSLIVPALLELAMAAAAQDDAECLMQAAGDLCRSLTSGSQVISDLQQLNYK